MDSFSDAVLSRLNVWLAWLGVFATAFGIVATMISIFVKNEISKRQSANEENKRIQLETANKEAKDARLLAEALKAKQAERTFTPHQRSELINKLRPLNIG